MATLESEYELYLHELGQHPDVIAFEAREPNSEGVGAITLHDLIAHALRHNPRRILVGEVRRDEIMPMLEAMNSGQDGSMCTLHANSPAEAFDRILILGLRGGLALAERAIHILVGMAVDLIVHVRRGYDGNRTVRFVTEILEVMPPGDTERPAVNRLFLPDPRTGRAVAAHTPSPGMLTRLAAVGFDAGLLEQHRAGQVPPGMLAAAAVAQQRWRQPPPGQPPRQQQPRPQAAAGLPQPAKAGSGDHAGRRGRRPDRRGDRAPDHGAHPAAARTGHAAARRPAGSAAATRKRALIAVGTGLVVLAVTRWPVAGIVAVAAVLFLPRITSARAAKQRVAVLEGLEQWTRRLSDMLTASRGLEDALEASARTAPAVIEPAVSRLARRLAARTGTEEALRAFAAEINDPAGDRIAAALIIATGRRGGGVRDVLNSLAVMLGRDVAARREIEADRAQHRTTVKWLTAFVAGFTIFAVLNRSYSAPYGTAAGELVLAFVAGLYAGGLLWLHHLGIGAGARPIPRRAAVRPRPGEPGMSVWIVAVRAAGRPRRHAAHPGACAGWPEPARGHRPAGRAAGSRAGAAVPVPRARA